MSEHFPADPALARFSQRYESEGFDPISARPLLSPTQVRTKMMPVIERPFQASNESPLTNPASLHVTNSPKRPLIDESDGESMQPRKVARGESPLKGAAGRRLVDAKRVHQRDASYGNGSAGNTNNSSTQQQGQPQSPRQAQILQQQRLEQQKIIQQQMLRPPPELPREVMFLLSIIPRAEAYKATVFNPQRMVELLRRTDVNRAGMSVADSQQHNAYQAPLCKFANFYVTGRCAGMRS